ncbi:MAG: tetratricopeptide repeat protein [Deltaproteobacteria bacterium]|nr:tetratricopeptide repeat protein [Deltaproteobacteria bacterium]
MGFPRAKTVCIAAWLTCLVGIFAPCSSVAQTTVVLNADTQFQFAETYFNKGDFYRAVGEYERFIHFFPQDPRVPTAMYQIGQAYFKGKRFAQAIEAFTVVTDRYPGTHHALKARLMISECYIVRKDFPAALFVLDRVLSDARDPDLRDQIFYRKGWIYLETDEWEKAKETFAKISSKNRDTYRLKQLSDDLNKKAMVRSKKPGLAGALAVLPGAGHLYCGRYQDAAIAFLLNGVMIAAAVEAFDNGNEALGALVTLFEIGFYAGNIYSAVNCAHKHNRKQSRDFLHYLKTHSRVRLSATRKKAQPAVLLSYRLSF